MIIIYEIRNFKFLLIVLFFLIPLHFYPQKLGTSHSFNLVKYDKKQVDKKRIGVWVWTTSDSTIFCPYKRGLIHGKMRIIYHKNKTFSDIIYKKGKIHGTYINYNLDGGFMNFYRRYKKGVLIEDKPLLFKGI